MEAVHYGVVGLGRAGWDIHVDQLRGRADARIVAVVDALPERRAQAVAEFGCQAYETFEEMLKQKDVEVVIVATPSMAHAPQTLMALKAGKHVVVEKPMAMNVAQCNRMIAAAKKYRRKLFVHQNFRFLPIGAHLQEIVDSGILGRLFHIRAYVPNFVRRNDWQTLVKTGGGTLNNTAPHYLDEMLQLMKSPVSQVMGDLQRIASPGDAEDHVKAFFRTENGITADLEISNAQSIPAPLPPRWTLCGANGTLVCYGKTSTIRWFDPKKLPKIKALEGAVPGRSYDTEDNIPWQEKIIPAEGENKATFYDNVAGVLRHGQKMRVTPESVREVIRLIALIRKGTKFPGVITTSRRRATAK